MRRADRILRLLQALRRHRRPVTAQTLADELEVSLRTVYRDMAALQAERVPVRGEAGIGYVLDEGYDLPPMMFDPAEIEAIILGLRWVERRGDTELVKAARDVVAKVGTVLPARLRPLLFDAGLLVPPFAPLPAEVFNLAEVRAAIRLGRKLHIDYVDEKERATVRTIWPIAIAYFEKVRLLIAWCELRQGFRHFRADRVRRLAVLDTGYPTRRAVLMKQWQDEMRREAPVCVADAVA
ncbi:MAG: helix-turn-helix transcriptional regulator [Pseudolabrys sp.]